MSRTLAQRVTALALDVDLRQMMAPLLDTLDALAPLIARADAWVRETAAHDAVAQRLMTVPGVGGVVALSYVATLDTPARFGGNAGRVSAYLGLVPGEHSSGERQRKGPMTNGSLNAALSARPGGVDTLASGPQGTCAAGLGRATRRTTRTTHRCDGVGASSESHSVCALARQHGVSPERMCGYRSVRPRHHPSELRTRAPFEKPVRWFSANQLD